MKYLSTNSFFGFNSEILPRPQIYNPQEEVMHPPDFHELQSSPDMGPSPKQMEAERNMVSAGN